MTYFITDKCIGCSVCKRVCPVDAITGKKKKQHKIDPEVCIDCDACGKICPVASILDEQKHQCERIRIRSRWPKPEFNLTICIACTICIELCPVDSIALTMENGTRETIRYPFLKGRRSCIGCGFCEEECPVNAIEMVEG